MFKKIVFFTLFCTFGFASNFDYKLKPQEVKIFGVFLEKLKCHQKRMVDLWQILVI